MKIPDEGYTTFGRTGIGGFDKMFGKERYSTGVGIGKRLNRHLGFIFIGDRYGDEFTKDKIDIYTNKRESEKEHIVGPSENIFADIGIFFDNDELHIRPLWLWHEQIKNKDKEKLETKSEKLETELEYESMTRKNIGLTLDHKHKFSSNITLDTSAHY